MTTRYTPATQQGSTAFKRAYFARESNSGFIRNETDEWNQWVDGLLTFNPDVEYMRPEENRNSLAEFHSVTHTSRRSTLSWEGPATFNQIVDFFRMSVRGLGGTPAGDSHAELANANLVSRSTVATGGTLNHALPALAATDSRTAQLVVTEAASTHEFAIGNVITLTAAATADDDSEHMLVTAVRNGSTSTEKVLTVVRGYIGTATAVSGTSTAILLTVFRWQFTPRLNNTNAQDTYSVFFGDNIRGFYVPYVMASQIQLSGTMGEAVNISAEMFGGELRGVAEDRELAADETFGDPREGRAFVYPHRFGATSGSAATFANTGLLVNGAVTAGAITSLTVDGTVGSVAIPRNSVLRVQVGSSGSNYFEFTYTGTDISSGDTPTSLTFSSATPSADISDNRPVQIQTAAATSPSAGMAPSPVTNIELDPDAQDPKLVALRGEFWLAERWSAPEARLETALGALTSSETKTSLALELEASSPIYAVGDVLKIDDELVSITAVGTRSATAQTYTVTRGFDSTATPAHTAASSGARGAVITKYSGHILPGLNHAASGGRGNSHGMLRSFDITIPTGVAPFTTAIGRLDFVAHVESLRSAAITLTYISEDDAWTEYARWETGGYRAIRLKITGPTIGTGGEPSDDFAGANSLTLDFGIRYDENPEIFTDEEGKSVVVLTAHSYPTYGNEEAYGGNPSGGTDMRIELVNTRAA